MPLDQLEKPKSYYELLEVPASASDAEIKRAFRRLALQYHPDRIHPTLDRRVTEMRFRLINEAYAHLKTPEKRAAYNDRLRGRNDNGINKKNASFWAQVMDIFKTPPASKNRSASK